MKIHGLLLGVVGALCLAAFMTPSAMAGPPVDAFGLSYNTDPMHIVDSAGTVYAGHSISGQIVLAPIDKSLVAFSDSPATKADRLVLFVTDDCTCFDLESALKILGLLDFAPSEVGGVDESAPS